MKRTAIALALMLAAGTAAAQDAGFYVGASAGQSKANDACEGISGAGVTCDDQTTTWKIFGGYQFNKNIGVELGYSDRLAQAEATSPFGRAEVSARVFELVAVPALPLNESFSVYAKLGVYQANSDGRATAGPNSITASDSNTGGTYGLGVAWHFNKNLALRADWQRYAAVGGDNLGEADIDTLNIGIAYKF